MRFPILVHSLFMRRIRDGGGMPRSVEAEYALQHGAGRIAEPAFPNQLVDELQLLLIKADRDLDIVAHLFTSDADELASQGRKDYAGPSHRAI